ncbi:MAG TPA: phosphatase PAP2 family protein [Galbitalea sp.]
MRYSVNAPGHARRVLPGMLWPLRQPVVAIVLGVVAVAVVSAAGFLLVKKDAVTQWDLSVNQWLSDHHVSFLTTIAHGIYTAFSPVEAIAITAVLTVIIFLVGRNWRAAGTFALTIAITWLPSDVLKILVDRPRPLASALADPFLPTPPDPSYPSGHMVFAASLAFTFIFMARGTRAMPWAILGGIVGIVVVAFALMYLGVHYPTDVAASILWSAGTVPAFLAIWDNYVVPRTYRKQDALAA